MDDAELVRATCNGDVPAFTALFDRHAARVHDLAMAMLRDRPAALEVVESSFLEASLRLRGLEQAHRLPVWLLAVTRRNAALRSASTAGPDRQPSLPNNDPDWSRQATLVWEAVADLPLRERTLIDLDLRQRLDGQDLADAMGVTLPQALDLQARMRDRIEKGLSGYLIARTAEGRCLGLTKVLKGWDGRFTPRDSARMASHVESCQVCNQIRFSLPSPFALYASALPAPFPAAVRPRVLERVVLPGAAPGMVPVPVPAPLDEATMAYQYPVAQPADPFAAPPPLPQAVGFAAEAAPSPWSGPVAPLPPAGTALPAPAPAPVLGPPTSPYAAAAWSSPAEPATGAFPAQDPPYGAQPYALQDPAGQLPAGGFSYAPGPAPSTGPPQEPAQPAPPLQDPLVTSAYDPWHGAVPSSAPTPPQDPWIQAGPDPVPAHDTWTPAEAAPLPAPARDLWPPSDASFVSEQAGWPPAVEDGPPAPSQDTPIDVDAIPLPSLSQNTPIVADAIPLPGPSQATPIVADAIPLPSPTEETSIPADASVAARDAWTPADAALGAPSYEIPTSADPTPPPTPAEAAWTPGDLTPAGTAGDDTWSGAGAEPMHDTWAPAGATGVDDTSNAVAATPLPAAVTQHPERSSGPDDRSAVDGPSPASESEPLAASAASDHPFAGSPPEAPPAHAAGSSAPAAAAAPEPAPPEPSPIPLPPARPPEQVDPPPSPPQEAS